MWFEYTDDVVGMCMVRKGFCFGIIVVDVKLVNWHEIWFEFTSLK